MKVLHLSSERTWRGGEQQIAYLIEELQKFGVSNFVACRKDSAFEKYCISQNLNHISLPFKGSFDFKTAQGVKYFANSHKVDVIHLHTSNSHSIGVISSILGCKAPMILTRRVDFPLKKGFLSRFKYNYSNIKKIVCVSEKIREIVSQDVSDPSKVITIHSGIDVGKFAEIKHYNFLKNKYKVDADLSLIGNVAAMAPHKDIFTFIDTAEILIREKTGAKFFLIGDGPLKEEVEKYIKDKGLQEEIFMTGFLNNIPEILKELHLFLFTSKTEGLGTIVLDAFASKLPVVSTNAGGIPEMVKHGETGMLADVGDAKVLAENVRLLLKDPELREKLIRNAYKKVSNFDRRITAQKNYEVYKEITNTNK
jgi:L-malate glycosyltransferase